MQAYLTQACVQIRKQSGHLRIVESAVERRHHSLAPKNYVSHSCIRCRSAAGQRGTLEDAVEIGRDFLQSEIVLLVTMSASDFVQVLPFRFLRRKRRDRVTPGDHRGNANRDTENEERALKGHPTSF